ncbi:MAG: RidA family protein [Clostridia bacterium]|jgi:enamine deaminase RidA (YjgF/YER057c/UK114 family)|nr:RidA family protein [Clostridia bacterium]
MMGINKIINEGVEIEPKYTPKKGIVVYRQVGNTLWISGHGPEDYNTNAPLYAGRIGGNLTFEEGYAAARECALIILAKMKELLGSLDRIVQVVKVFALVNCEDGFSDVEGVMNGFSDTISSILEERGVHARTVMGTHNMPNHNIPVEVEAIFEIA